MRYGCTCSCCTGCTSCPPSTTFTPALLPGSPQLDYGRILYETRQYAWAKAVLGPLLLPEPANVEALTMLGIIA